jgi:AraC-like DNA-binding protein
MAVSHNAESLDLQLVEHGRRALAWRQAAGTLFPGLEVETLTSEPLYGSIRGRPFGQGEIWSILSPPLCVRYQPLASTRRVQSVFSVMLQLHGATHVRQQDRQTLLRCNDVCVLDGVAAFQLEVTTPRSSVMFLRIPRELVLCRYPGLEHRTAQAFDSEEGGTVLLRQMLLSLLESASVLNDEQCAVALVSAAHLLGLPKLAEDTSAHSIPWRVHRALACIDENLSDPMLNASRVAEKQGVSRRWLDEIFQQTLSSSLDAQIWVRRLAQAAFDLRDASQASRTVTSIAFSLGFADAAHFARSFKRRYGCSPSEWRSRN